MRSASIEARSTASLFAYPRVGFVVPRYKHSAVARNLLKRRLKEIVRLTMLPSMPPSDTVLRVHPVAYKRTWTELREEVERLVAQLKRLHGAL